MAGGNFDIASWKIQNFSCWSRVLHGRCIESPKIGFVDRNIKMKLYPRGTTGLRDHMEVHLSVSTLQKEFSGDLSIIGADGSSLYTQRVHSKGKSELQLPPGPKFEEVIFKRGENESDLKDQLALRFQSKSDAYDENHVCTAIQVFEVTLDVNPSVILKDRETISYIEYIHDDCEGSLYLGTGRIRKDNKIELYLEPDTEDTFLVKTHLRLINGVGSLLRYENNEHMFKKIEPWQISESMTKREVSENVRSVILHFKIISGKVNHTLENVYLYSNDIKIISKRYVSVCEEKYLNVITHKDHENASVGDLVKELTCLYQGQDFSDLQLKCDDVTFPVHKAFLSARSPVFKTMLSTDMAEAASGCVDIGDLDPSTLSRFLAFLYTGAVEDLQGVSALKLYYAADKYHVPSLKRECVGFLRANVSLSNVCDVLSLGDKHQDRELTAAAHDFILRNFNEVLKSKEWKGFMCSEPLLAAKTVTLFACQRFYCLEF